MSWIDAHVHVWTQDQERYPWRESYPLLAGVRVKLPEIEPRDFPPEVLLRHANASDVDRIVLVQMSFYGTDNSYMTDAIASYPDVFRGIAYVDPESPRVAEEMAALLDRGVTGFRILPRPGTEDRWLRTPGYDAMFTAAAETRQAVCALVNPDALREVDRMCRRHPETATVIDHMARIGADGHVRGEDVDALCSLSAHPNVHVKVSAFYALGAKKPPHDDLLPMVRRLYDAYGADRLMWASDCPFQVLNETYEDSISLLRDRIGYLSAVEKEQLLRGTAERLFYFR